MTEKKEFSNMRSLLGALATSMNLINRHVEHHHEQTAYLAYMIAREMQLTDELTHLCIYASIMHDIGSVMLSKEATVAEVEREAKKMSLMGAELLSDIPGFTKTAEVIKYCQNSWQDIERSLLDYPQYREYGTVAAIVHLADSISIMINSDMSILNQSKTICKTVTSKSGTEFMPEAVNAFVNLSKYEYIWLDLLKHPSYFLMIFAGKMRSLTLEETDNFVKIMSRIIDYRSPFTAMHSAGVAASAFELSKLLGMSEDDCMKIKIAGYLHDIGKLVVPKDILEKPGKLTDEEFNIIKEHPYYTKLILMNVDGFSDIANWAGHHHEKLNGRGYPFHFGADILDKGSRIMAAADIFSAITEERPYRKGMPKEQAMSVMIQNAENDTICQGVVNVLLNNYEQVDSARDKASREAGKRYFDSIEKTEK